MGDDANKNPKNPREGEPNRDAIRLLDGQMADESGYDGETSPELQEARDRDRLGYRKPFPA